MKITFVALLSITLTLATAQEVQDKSNYAQFSNRQGVLLKKEFIDFGSIEKVKVQILKMFDFGSEVSTIAVRFEFVYTSSYSSTTKIGVLDESEIAQAIAAISQMQQSVFSKQAFVYTEAAYTSLSGMEIGCYYVPEKETWTAFVKLSKYDRDSYYYFKSFDSLIDLKALLETMQQRIEETK